MTAALIGRFAEPVLTFPLQAPQSSTDKPCGLAGATICCVLVAGSDHAARRIKLGTEVSSRRSGCRRNDGASHVRKRRMIVKSDSACARFDAELAPQRRQVRGDWPGPHPLVELCQHVNSGRLVADRKSTRLNSSHGYISYAV